MNCVHCGEPILAGESPAAFSLLKTMHRECIVRLVAGSAAHQLGECRCYGYTREDPALMSKRDAARLAVQMWEALNPPALEASL